MSWVIKQKNSNEYLAKDEINYTYLSNAMVYKTRKEARKGRVKSIELVQKTQLENELPSKIIGRG